MFLFRRKPKPTDYDTILSELTSSITSHQQRLADIRLRERRATVWLTTWVLVGWLVYWGAWWAGLVKWALGGWEDGEGGLREFLAWVGVGLGPVLVLFARRIAGAWYTRKGDAEEKQLRNLRTQLVKKLEEVKTKASYNEARGLLERYGAPAGVNPDLRPQPPSVPSAGKKARFPPPPSSVPRQPQTPAPATPLKPVPGALPGTPQPATPFTAASTPSVPITTALPRAPRAWYDKLADAILGDDPSSPASMASQQYALICENCAKHNGLVGREQWADLQWECRFCHHLNLSPRAKAAARQRSSNMQYRAATSPLAMHTPQRPSSAASGMRIEREGSAASEGGYVIREREEPGQRVGENEEKEEHGEEAESEGKGVADMSIDEA